MSTKPETQVEGAALIDLIVRDVCETDPADHDKPDTLFIKVSDLRAILESRLEEAALLAADGKAGGEVIWQNPDLEHMAEEAECVSKCLDDRGVPKSEDDKSLSLWGRVCRYKDGGWEKASAHLRCPRCGHEREIKMETARIDTRPQQPAQVAQPLTESNAVMHLRALVTALDNAFISSWQSTAAWQKELDLAKDFLGIGKDQA